MSTSSTSKCVYTQARERSVRVLNIYVVRWENADTSNVRTSTTATTSPSGAQSTSVCCVWPLRLWGGGGSLGSAATTLSSKANARRCIHFGKGTGAEY